MGSDILADSEMKFDTQITQYEIGLSFIRFFTPFNQSIFVFIY